MSGDTSEIKDLLQRAVAGEEAAQRELFSRYRDRLKRICTAPCRLMLSLQDQQYPIRALG
jgi:hypothetical protein